MPWLLDGNSTFKVKWGHWNGPSAQGLESVFKKPMRIWTPKKEKIMGRFSGKIASRGQERGLRRNQHYWDPQHSETETLIVEAGKSLGYCHGIVAHWASQAAWRGEVRSSLSWVGLGLSPGLWHQVKPLATWATALWKWKLLSMFSLFYGLDCVLHSLTL